MFFRVMAASGIGDEKFDFEYSLGTLAVHAGIQNNPVS